jgi:hypothetical protein
MLCRTKTKTIAALKKKKKRRREKKKKKRGKEGSNTGPISAQCCPKCARRETLDPNGPESPMHPHRRSKGLDCSVIALWVFDWIQSGLKLFFLKIRRIEIWFCFLFLGGFGGGGWGGVGGSL